MKLQTHRPAFDMVETNPNNSIASRLLSKDPSTSNLSIKPSNDNSESKISY